MSVMYLTSSADDENWHELSHRKVTRKHVKNLFSRGKDPGLTDIYGNTALHIILTYHTNPDLVRTLLEDPRTHQIIDKPNHYGFTPLMIACGGRDSNPEIVGLILTYKPSLKHRSLDGLNTPFSITYKTEIESNVKQLLNYDRRSCISQIDLRELRTLNSAIRNIIHKSTTKQVI